MDYSLVNTWFIENALRPVFRRKCLLGKKTFYPKKWFRPTKELEDSYNEILEELNKMMKRVDDFLFFNISALTSFIYQMMINGKCSFSRQAI